jgi:hypothetical protein
METTMPEIEVPKPALLVPRPTEAEGHPITHLLLDSHQHPYLNINDPEPRRVRESLERWLHDQSSEWWEFQDLFGEPAWLWRGSAHRIVAVVQSYARKVPARSDFFRVEPTS